MVMPDAIFRFHSTPPPFPRVPLALGRGHGASLARNFAMPQLRSYCIKSHAQAGSTRQGPTRTVHDSPHSLTASPRRSPAAAPRRQTAGAPPASRPVSPWPACVVPPLGRVPAARVQPMPSGGPPPRSRSSPRPPSSYHHGQERQPDNEHRRREQRCHGAAQEPQLMARSSRARQEACSALCARTRSSQSTVIGPPGCTTRRGRIG